MPTIDYYGNIIDDNGIYTGESDYLASQQFAEQKERSDALNAAAQEVRDAEDAWVSNPIPQNAQVLDAALTAATQTARMYPPTPAIPVTMQPTSVAIAPIEYPVVETMLPPDSTTGELVRYPRQLQPAETSEGVPLLVVGAVLGAAHWFGWL